MKYPLFLLFSFAVFSSCLDDDAGGGFSTDTTRLAINNFDLNLDTLTGGGLVTVFTPSDSTLILQITRTVDPDLSVAGDESRESIFIVLDNSLSSFEFTETDWAALKTFAFTSGQFVEQPVGTITGGSLLGTRDIASNNWFLEGTVEVSEPFAPTFPLFMSGNYFAR